MADNEGNSLFPVPWAPLIAVLAAIAGIAALLPSRSARPTAPTDATSAGMTVGISARLWQDPLSVAREDAARGTQERKKDAAAATTEENPDEFRQIQDVYNRLSRTWGVRPVVLVVCEPSSPYAEDVERRIRDRSAVVQALAAEGYLPEQSTALQYIKVWNSTEARGSDKANGKPQVLPYETFYQLGATADFSRGEKPLARELKPPIEERKRPVLVLWLADGALKKTGLLDELAIIAKRFKDCWPEQPAETMPKAGSPPLAGTVQKDLDSDAPVIRVLGPASSSQYRLMLGETDWDNIDYPLSNLAATKIYACNVSAPDEALAAGIPWMSEAAAKYRRRPTENALTEKLQQKGALGFHLVRTICADDKLATALWRELARRGVSSTDDIAAVAELDSVYGRASMLAFLRTRPGAPEDMRDFLDKHRDVSPPNVLDLETMRKAAPHISTYTYMMGLDGALPKNALGSEEQKSREADKGIKSPAVTQDPSEGLSQVDYFRRLADRLNLDDRHLNSDGRSMRAVAILGSDIYDKLQILRTLRPQLPNALFLTDNLDARFAHPDEWAETRNLLVASNYALTPRKEWYSEAPPFRDSSQAAFYAATRMVFEHSTKLGRWLGKPLLFEIGRNGPVPLRSGLDATAWVQLPELAASAKLKHNLVWRVTGCLLIVLVFAMLLKPGAVPSKVTLDPFSPDRLHVLHRKCLGGLQAVLKHHRHDHGFTLTIPVIAGLGLLITALRYKFQDPSSKEPLAILDGISIWPGDFIRTCSLLLSIHWVFRILKVLECNAHTLEERFPILKHNRFPLHAWSGESQWDLESDSKPRFWPRFEEDDDEKKKRSLFYRRWNRLSMHTGYWWGVGKLAWLNFWPHTHDYNDEKTQLVDVARWWGRYKVWTDPCKRIGRAAMLVVLYIFGLLWFLKIVYEPLPVFPVRGIDTAFWTTLIVWVAGPCGLLVTFLVVDATELNIRAIRDLHRGRSHWHFGKECWRDKKLRVRKYIDVLEPEDCADYLDIDLIARRSDAVNRLIYYPFILLTLLLVGRWTMTDSYQWNPAFLFGIGANAAWMIYCSIRLPLEAREARRKSLARLRSKLLVRRVEESHAAKDKPAESVDTDPKIEEDGKRVCKKSSVCALEQVIKEIENMKRGAFVGIWHQPIVHAVLFPSGGLGISALLELLPH